MHAIHTLDLHYVGIPQALAAFVVFDRARGIGPVLIETGPASTIAALEAELNRVGVALREVREALVTHIHLDHAGAAGRLARSGTRILVHEFGAKHLIDPARLIDSATRIYGEQMDRLWGRIEPAPLERVAPLRDGDVVDVGSGANALRFRAIETPGHARHHHAFALELDGERVCFVGDAAGFNAPAVSDTFVSVPTPPPEFDLEAWIDTIARLRRERFDAIYLTHFGRIQGPAVDAHFGRLAEIIPQHVEFIGRRVTAEMPRETVLREYVEWNRRDAAAHGIDDRAFARYVTRNLLAMNVDGIVRYLGKRNP